jgi:opacity protein-like surface antigen
MRALILSLLAAGPVFAAGPLGIGVKGGVPFTDFTNAVSSGSFNYTASTQRYIVGPMLELRLPFGLGVEFDALYRRFHWTGISTLGSNVVTAVTDSNAWEFPLVAKYKFHGGPARPYIEGGVAWDTLQGLKTSVLSSTGIAASSPVRQKSTVAGFVMGAGLDIHAIFVHISPEIRYTRWGAEHFLDPNGGFHSNQNQAEFLIGITF